MNILRRLFTWLSNRLYPKELSELEYLDDKEYYEPDYYGFEDDYYPDEWEDEDHDDIWFGYDEPDDYYEEDYMDGEE